MVFDDLLQRLNIATFTGITLPNHNRRKNARQTFTDHITEQTINGAGAGRDNTQHHGKGLSFTKLGQQVKSEKDQVHPLVIGDIVPLTGNGFQILKQMRD